MAPFRWPLPLNDVMLATEVAARKPTCATEWDVIASILSNVFNTNERKIVLTGRACRETLDRVLFCGEIDNITHESFVLMENDRRVA